MTADQTTQKAANKRSSKSRMFESPEAANLWFDIFNGVLLTGAFLVAVGTWGTIKTASIKERFSDDRVSANEVETKRAIADSDSAKEGTAKANERIAGLNNDTARLQSENLALQTVLLPRRIALSSLSAPHNADTWFAPMAKFDSVSFAVQPVDDAEARSLAEEIVLGLAFVGISAEIDEGMLKYNPNSSSEGVVVSFPTGDLLLEKAGNALADALTKAGLGIGDMPVYRHGGIPPDPRDIASGLVNPIHKGVVVSVGQRPVSHVVAKINRERAISAGKAAADSVNAK